MARKPYVELPDILKLLPSAAEVDTEPEVGGPGGLLNQIKDLYKEIPKTKQYESQIKKYKEL